MCENRLSSGKNPQKPSQAGAWEGVFLSFHTVSLVVGISIKPNVFNRFNGFFVSQRST
jgi:hypothetical protein